MDWQEIVVTTTEEAVDAVANIMQELGSGGVVIEAPALVKHYLEYANWDAHALPEKLLTLQNVKIKAYYPMDENLPGKIEEIKLMLKAINQTTIPDSILNIEYGRLAEEDWAHAWKAFYKPVKVGRRIIIKPSWEEYRSNTDELIIELDPGMAFGTGTHATTVMCLQALEEVLQGGEIIYDVGTGSGVLAIAAAKLGAGEIKAIDLDAIAVKVAAENVQLNGVHEQVKVLAGNLLDMVQDKAQLVVANIIATVIIQLAPAVREILTPGGIFIASGIIEERWPDVQQAIDANGLIIKEVKRTKEWVAVIAEKGE